jgi:hypothetical protein
MDRFKALTLALTPFRTFTLAVAAELIALPGGLFLCLWRKDTSMFGAYATAVTTVCGIVAARAYGEHREKAKAAAQAVP